MDNSAREQAQAQLRSICDMVAALECDFERLEEMQDERAALVDEVEEARECVARHHDDTVDDNGGYPEHEEARRCAAELAEWDEENSVELEALRAAAGECDDEDAARELIEQDALSVEVRSDWTNVGVGEACEPAEYRIVLCTGGPHVELIGELNDGEPCTARLLYQDWGTRKDALFCDQDDTKTLLTYARVFYYGL